MAAVVGVKRFSIEINKKKWINTRFYPFFILKGKRIETGTELEFWITFLYIKNLIKVQFIEFMMSIDE